MTVDHPPVVQVRAPDAAAFAAAAGPYVVDENPGGWAMNEAIWDALSAGRLTIIAGDCKSLCVHWAFKKMRADPTSICLTYRAVFGLHQGYHFETRDAGSIRAGTTVYRYTQQVVVYDGSPYQPELTAWADAHGGLPASTTDTLPMYPAESIKLGWRMCAADELPIKNLGANRLPFLKGAPEGMIR